MKTFYSLSLILICCLYACHSMSAQGLTNSDNPPPKGEKFSSRIFTGGNLGLQFGTQTLIEIAPIIGYRFTEKFSAGFGAKYIYYKYKDDFFSYSTNIYGGSIFSRYLILENLFAHVEYEVLNLEVFDYTFYELRRKNITSVFVGGGYRQMIGDRSSMNLMLLYNINESSDSPYSNPIIRIGFGIGI